jgi:hypothetical protein
LYLNTKYILLWYTYAGVIINTLYNIAKTNAATTTIIATMSKP